MSDSHAPTVTRFAPSPTGHLHIGGARTALFCYAFARTSDGRFMIRVEDTDTARSTEASMHAILRNLDWLGITWDDGPKVETETGTVGGDERGVGPYFQSERLDIYQRYIDKLVDEGKAYPAFETPEEIAEKRAHAQSEKKQYKYDRAALKLSAEERQQRIDAGAPHVIRFKVPDDEDLVVDDTVLGEVRFRAGETEDFVIRKADGYPTYHFAVVVDDELMGVTHVLRGQEHLNNTPKHVALQKALGFETPVYAHMPLIFNDKGAKMSKRERDKVMRDAINQKQLTNLGVVLFSAIKSYLANADIAASSKKTYRSHLQSIMFSLSEDELQSMPLTDIELHSKFPYLSESSLKGAQSAWNSFLNSGWYERLLDMVPAWMSDKASQLPSDVLDSIAEALSVYLPEVSVHEFRKAGYLPEVIVNFIALLGWTPPKSDDGSEIEKFDMDFLCEHFDITDIGKSNARFDRNKLLAFNTDVITTMDAGEFVERFRSWAAHYGEDALAKIEPEKLDVLLRAIQGQCKTFQDAFERTRFARIDADEIEYDEKAVKKFLLKKDGQGLALLGEFRETLATLDDFAPEPVHESMKAFAESKGVGMGAIAQPLRIAMTGTPVSPGIGETLAVVGRDGAMKRIDRCLARTGVVSNG